MRPDSLAVLAEQVRGIVRGGDPVVPLPGGLGHPSRHRDAQLDPADARMVPEQAVSEVGHQERDADLGVALHQLDDGALLVEPAVLVLAEPVEALPVPGVEQHLEVVRAAAGRGVPARRRPGEVRRRLGQQLTAVGAEETQLSRSGHLGGQPAVGDRGLVRRRSGCRRRRAAPSRSAPGRSSWIDCHSVPRIRRLLRPQGSTRTISCPPRHSRAASLCVKEPIRSSLLGETRIRIDR